MLLLDEIAGGLTEARGAGNEWRWCGNSSSSHCIIWIEHIPQALHAACDRIMVLHFGRKLLEAAPREAMSSALVREIYMGLADRDDRAA